MKKENSNISYEPQVLKKLHDIQLQMLEDVSKVCNKHNIQYFAIYGTAIGAVRHQGFIPWDDDIDIGMLRADYDKFLSIFYQELGETYSLLTPEIDGRYACTVTHIQKKGTKFVSEMSKDLKCEQGIFIDIFPFDYVAREKKLQLKQKRSTNIWGKLLFLAGTGAPLIPFKGLVGMILKMMCKLIHIALVFFRITPKQLYRRYLRAAIRYNNSMKKSEYVTSFEYTGCLKDKIKAKDIFPLKSAKFENLEVNIPNNNHEFLKKVYGDYMALPPEDERVNHMPLVIEFEDDKCDA